MSTPDLRGTQGRFSQSPRVGEASYQSGSRYPLNRTDAGLEGSLEGPENTMWEDGGTMQVPFRINLNGKGPQLEIAGESYPLEPGVYTPWIKLQFHAGLGVKVSRHRPFHGH